MENYDAGQTVKLSCRNVWKIYGDTSDSFFMDRNGNVDDPQAHVKKILKSEHIVANADVSFDVYAGEIFVIMGLSGSENRQSSVAYLGWSNQQLVISFSMAKTYLKNRRKSSSKFVVTKWVWYFRASVLCHILTL